MAPKIFTFFRSPVTGTSGGQPTRLHVAWRVESCRKLASSVKSSAQFCARAFFNVGIGIALPTITLGGSGSRQYAFRSLHGKANLVKNLADVTRMVLNSEFFL